MSADRVYQMAGLPLQQVELHWEALDDALTRYYVAKGLPRSLCATWNYLDNVELDKQGCQPEELTEGCYTYALDVVKAEAAHA